MSKDTFSRLKRIDKVATFAYWALLLVSVALFITSVLTMNASLAFGALACTITDMLLAGVMCELWLAHGEEVSWILATQKRRWLIGYDSSCGAQASKVLDTTRRLTLKELKYVGRTGYALCPKHWGKA